MGKDIQVEKCLEAQHLASIKCFKYLILYLLVSVLNILLPQAVHHFNNYLGSTKSKVSPKIHICDLFDFS